MNVLGVSALVSVGEKSGARARTCVAGPKLDLRRHALMLALGLALLLSRAGLRRYRS